LFDLPLRLGDASALAAILFDQLGSNPKPITDDARSRIAARTGGTRFENMCPQFASIERDPIHPSAYFICVDAIDRQPLLLRVAPASTPSSGIFPQAILIGRTFLGTREVVLNAVPFSPADHERILAFSQQINTAFQPKPFGSKPVIRVRSDAPAHNFPTAFEGFRKILRATGQNLACFAVFPQQNPLGFYYETLWSAIRAGWREGFTIEAYPKTEDEARATSMYTRFGLTSGDLIPTLRDAKRKPFDVELITVPGNLEIELARLRDAGYAAQSVASADGEELIARQYRATINTREILLTQTMTRDDILELFV
jgi:hypothetical protein